MSMSKGSFEGLLEGRCENRQAVLKGCWRINAVTRAVLKGCWRNQKLAEGSFEGLLEGKQFFNRQF